ncbi:MAG: hypothetical protein ACI8TE_000945 [Francisella sp.]
MSDVIEAYIDQNNLRDKYDYVDSAIGTSSQNQANSNYVDSTQGSELILTNQKRVSKKL